MRKKQPGSASSFTKAVRQPAETHLQAGAEQAFLGNNQNVPIADEQNSLKAGVRGPLLLEDFILREKITRFDHERIPERIVHPSGSRALLDDTSGGSDDKVVCGIGSKKGNEEFIARAKAGRCWDRESSLRSIE